MYPCIYDSKWFAKPTRAALEYVKRAEATLEFFKQLQSARPLVTESGRSQYKLGMSMYINYDIEYNYVCKYNIEPRGDLETILGQDGPERHPCVQVNTA